MKRYSILLAPMFSFFSPGLYRDVGARWRVKAFACLLLVLAVSWVPTMVEMSSGWRAFVADTLPEVVTQIPPITIRNGRVTADVEQPYFIHRPETDEPFAIIDTTGQFESLEGTPARLLLTENKLIVEKNTGETRIYPLGAVQEFYIDGAKAEGWIRTFGTWGLLVLYPIMVSGSFAYRVVQVLLYSAIGLLLAKVNESPLSYPGILAVTAVAVTPAIVAKTVVGMTGIKVPFGWGWLIYSAIVIGYVLLALEASKHTTPNTAEPAPPEQSSQP